MTKHVAVGWFPAGEYEKAVSLWPDLVESWHVSGYAEYCLAFDRHLRQLELGPETQVVLAPIELKHFLKWCGRAGLDSGASESRTKYATETATRGRVRKWPPKAEDRCWCGRDEKYELCCGRP